MKQLLTFLTIMLFASGAYAKGTNNDADIQASTHYDGILFDVKGNDVDLQLSVAGPGNFAYSKRYAYAESVFFNTTNARGKALPDGLYKWEARAIPAVSISRQESSAMPDRNVLNGKTDPKMSPVSGTFRIVDGSVVDPNRDEYGEKLSLLSKEAK